MEDFTASGILNIKICKCDRSSGERIKAKEKIKINLFNFCSFYAAMLQFGSHPGGKGFPHWLEKQRTSVRQTLRLKEPLRSLRCIIGNFAVAKAAAIMAAWEEGRTVMCLVVNGN